MQYGCDAVTFRRGDDKIDRELLPADAGHAVFGVATRESSFPRRGPVEAGI
jgi:hypothetical protein